MVCWEANENQHRAIYCIHLLESHQEGLPRLVFKHIHTQIFFPLTAKDSQLCVEKHRLTFAVTRECSLRVRVGFWRE